MQISRSNYRSADKRSTVGVVIRFAGCISLFIYPMVDNASLCNEQLHGFRQHYSHHPLWTSGNLSPLQVWLAGLTATQPPQDNEALYDVCGRSLGIGSDYYKEILKIFATGIVLIWVKPWDSCTWNIYWRETLRERVLDHGYESMHLRLTHKARNIITLLPKQLSRAPYRHGLCLCVLPCSSCSPLTHIGPVWHWLGWASDNRH